MDSQSHHTGIEIVEFEDIISDKVTLNRTILELKSKSVRTLPLRLRPLNRTILELKFIILD